MFWIIHYVTGVLCCLFIFYMLECKEPAWDETSKQQRKEIIPWLLGIAAFSYIGVIFVVVVRVKMFYEDTKRRKS